MWPRTTGIHPKVFIHFPLNLLPYSIPNRICIILAHYYCVVITYVKHQFIFNKKKCLRMDMGFHFRVRALFQICSMVMATRLCSVQFSHSVMMPDSLYILKCNIYLNFNKAPFFSKYALYQFPVAAITYYHKPSEMQ